MSKIVLIEQLSPTQANLIAESSTDGKSHWLNGIFCQADIQNGNGRVYPLSEITKAVEYFNSKVKEGSTICGELNHPDNLQINLDRVSHVITEMRMDGANAIGKAKILNTPTGNIVKALLEGGVRLGVSSRGTGNVNEGVVSDFQFVTVDIVSTPSAPNAYPSHMMEAMSDDKKVRTLAEEVVSDKKAQAHLVKAVMNLFDSLKK
jgi:hypothetical protein